MTTSFAAPVTQLDMISLVPMLDLFALEKPTRSFLGKQPCTDDKPEERYVHVRMIKEEELELALRKSRHNEERRQVRATKRWEVLWTEYHH